MKEASRYTKVQTHLVLIRRVVPFVLIREPFTTSSILPFIGGCNVRRRALHLCHLLLENHVKAIIWSSSQLVKSNIPSSVGSDVN